MATEKRLDLIDRKNLIKAVEKKQFASGDNTHPYEAIRIQGKYFREVVEGALTVDAVEVVHGEWRYCNYGTEDFNELQEAYPTADFICGRDGDSYEEMMFIVEWARKRK